MHITLIKPRIGHKGMERYVDAGRMEPLQLAILAAMIPPSCQISFYDDRCDTIPFHAPTNAVFITVETFTALRAYEIAARYRKHGIPVILGGMHPTLLPEEAVSHADAVFTGDAEYGFKALLADLMAGQLKPLYKGALGIPQPDLRPRRSIYKGKGYLPINLLQLSRGCIHKCHFCATSRYFGGQSFLRDPDEVVAEIREDCGKILFFVDDNFIAQPEYAKILMEKLIPLKRLWVTQVTSQAGDDPELLRLMQRSGCLGFVIGFESLSAASLSWMNKEHNLQGFNHYQAQIAAIHKHNLNIWAAFSLGHDFDTPAGIRRTCQFALDNNFAFAAFNILTPYPGTPLYDSLKAENRLLFEGRWWLSPDYLFNHAVFKPAKMSAAELTRLCWEARRRFNSFSRITKRIAHFRTGLKHMFMLFFYMQYCRIFRHEIYQKQGLSLGAGQS